MQPYLQAPFTGHSGRSWDNMLVDRTAQTNRESIVRLAKNLVELITVSGLHDDGPGQFWVDVAEEEDWVAHAFSAEGGESSTTRQNLD